ncbi:hypothetical protein BKA69DRAFT_402843 [Paraphysoderma sedebokerense]|nr:hypothetical protein BKA69DRAFT_402843 [Paraphysoderma sedebokerense]
MGESDHSWDDDINDILNSDTENDRPTPRKTATTSDENIKKSAYSGGTNVNTQSNEIKNNQESLTSPATPTSKLQASALNSQPISNTAVVHKSQIDRNSNDSSFVKPKHNINTRRTSKPDKDAEFDILALLEGNSNKSVETKTTENQNVKFPWEEKVRESNTPQNHIESSDLLSRMDMQRIEKNHDPNNADQADSDSDDTSSILDISDKSDNIRDLTTPTANQRSTPAPIPPKSMQNMGSAIIPRKESKESEPNDLLSFLLSGNTTQRRRRGPPPEETAKLRPSQLPNSSSIVAPRVDNLSVMTSSTRDAKSSIVLPFLGESSARNQHSIKTDYEESRQSINSTLTKLPHKSPEVLGSASSIIASTKEPPTNNTTLQLEDEIRSLRAQIDVSQQRKQTDGSRPQIEHSQALTNLTGAPLNQVEGATLKEIVHKFEEKLKTIDELRANFEYSAISERQKLSEETEGNIRKMQEKLDLQLAMIEEEKLRVRL